MPPRVRPPANPPSGEGQPPTIGPRVALDLRSLEVFYWVAQLGGFRRAAEKLHTTQPAVSARIAQMEAAVHVRLLDRDRRRQVTLTPKGVELLAYAERLLALQHEAVAAMTDPTGLRGTVRLGASETIVHTWLSTLVRRVHEAYPRVTLDISVDITASLRDSLLAGELDVALLLGPVNAPHVTNLALCEFPLAWAASPALPVGRQSLSLAQLARWPMITYSRATRPHAQLTELFNQPGVPPLRIFGNSSLASIVRMAIDGIGIAVIAPAAIAAELQDGRLRLLRTRAALAPLGFTASWIESPGSNLAAAVGRLAQDVARAFDNPG